MSDNNLPFMWGVQYYRAPTPSEDCWESDLRKIKEIGFDSIKYWVQWRWSHREPGKFYFDDLDKLMDLALKYQLKVTLNIILDVAPDWLYENHPDVKMIMNDGTVVEPMALPHRQIGGHPGPCYNHPIAIEEKEKFIHAVFKHFKDHKALSMWDVWNEPELCCPQRFPIKTTKLACYCENCQREFRLWLKKKYVTLEKLNTVWGRCYSNWDSIEPSRSESTINDFIDWREFQTDSLTKDAKTRLRLAHKYSPDKINFLHVVPNDLNVWNPVTCCSDDFDLAKDCDVFASTMTGSDYIPQLVLSAARGKICYNVESHINSGNISMHQRCLKIDDLNKNLLPQAGMGIKGFMFWQYRPELLGTEAPAWGVVNPDGSDREITKAIRIFGDKVLPLSDRIMKSFPKEAEVGIWKSFRNELFHYCGNNMEALHKSLSNYSEVLYWSNFRYCFINSEMIEKNEIQNLKVIIMPCPYFLTGAEAATLDKWVRDGGILLAEAHFGGYNADTGRHSMNIPGFGLDEKWKINESMSCSSFHLNYKSNTDILDLEINNDDLRKALQSSGLAGDKYFPIALDKDILLWGAHRYAELAGEISPMGEFTSNHPCIASISVGNGKIFYCGSNLGYGAEKDKTGLKVLLKKVMNAAKVETTLNAKIKDSLDVHIDALYSENDKQATFLVLNNRGDQAGTLEVISAKKQSLTGLFSQMNIELIPGNNSISLPADFIDIFA